MVQISVIVPVYNVEKYLASNVQSILTQTYRDFELILVDDGSPDRCGDLCDQYALQDSRVRVVHKKNGGLSSARNAGLDVMKGRFVTFIDSDDVVHPQYLETLITLQEKEQADISMCHYDFFENEGMWDNDAIGPDTQAYERLSGKQLLDHFQEHCRKVSILSQCMKLYKSEIFDGLRMREGYTQEDSMALPYVLERADKIVRTPAKLYHWRVTPGSISRSGFNKTAFDYIEISYCWAEFFSERGSDQARYFKRDFLDRTLKYYYKIVDQKPELMPDFAFHLKRYRKLYPKYIRAKGLCRKEILAYTLFLISPKTARKFYMQVHGEKYRTETW